jgi:hypothetical protein
MGNDFGARVLPEFPQFPVQRIRCRHAAAMAVDPDDRGFDPAVMPGPVEFLTHPRNLPPLGNTCR